jgi:hypothetical protein
VKKLISAFSILLFTSLSSYAQIGFEQLLKAGPADAATLVSSYGDPLFKGFGLGMNSGWTNTAKTLGFMRFDIRVTGTAVVVPSSARAFDVTKIGLSNHLQPADPANVMSPTFSGNTESNGPLMNLFDDYGNKITSFDLPPGVLKGFVPSPQLQVTLGLVLNTDVTVRWAPKIVLNNDFGSVSTIGFGIKHNIMDDFAGAKGEHKPFDLAFAFSYNRVRYQKDLDLQPLDGSVPKDPEQVKDFSTQAVYGNFDNYLVQMILSKQLSFFTPYVAIGYNTSKTQFGIEGNFPIPSGISGDQLSYTTYTDPVKIDLTHVRGVRADMGFQLKFPILTIFASYGLAERYSLVNAGIGIGI